jgi:hypothetical protein
MLIKVLPNQIAERWKALEPIIKVSLPPMITGSDAAMKEILQALISGRLNCWLYGKDEKSIYAVLTTKVVNDTETGCRNLIIFSLTGIRAMNDSIWRDGYSLLRQFAKQQGCKNIIAYTNSKRVIESVKSLGANTDTTLIVLEV